MNIQSKRKVIKINKLIRKINDIKPFEILFILLMLLITVSIDVKPYYLTKYTNIIISNLDILLIPIYVQIILARIFNEYFKIFFKNGLNFIIYFIVVIIISLLLKILGSIIF